MFKLLILAQVCVAGFIIAIGGEKLVPVRKVEYVYLVYSEPADSSILIKNSYPIAFQHKNRMMFIYYNNKIDTLFNE